MQNSKIVNFLKIFLFFTVLGTVGLLSLILTRPTESESEKRKLAEFPEFSFSALLNGDYATAIDKWYSDTMPNRDSLIALNSKLWSIKGITLGGQIEGTVTDGDDIPDSFDGPIIPPISIGGDTTTTTTTKPNETETTTEKETGETINALFVYKDTAYSYYSFIKSTSAKYVGAVETAAVNLDGIANVYDIIIPLSTDIILNDSIRKDLNTSDQRAAINYMYSGFNNTITVSIFDKLREHRDEYLYFRTDHHWTALAAYYTYTQWAEVKGITPNDLSSYETMTFDGFLGTLYAKTNNAPALGANPDEVVAYIPNGTNSMTYTDKDGKQISWRVITDVTTWMSNSKYNTFIGGDNPFAVIENPTITDGSSCVVVKESFGNAFVPFLVDHYQYVYVIDYRYYTGNFYNFVKENNVTDVIFINNISATSTSARVNDLSKLVGY